MVVVKKIMIEKVNLVFKKINCNICNVYHHFFYERKHENAKSHQDNERREIH